MILVHFRGGLGNQLFQYALGRHLSLINKRPLRFDKSSYTAIKPDPRLGVRLFGLEAFSVSGEVATSDELRRFERYRGNRPTARLARLVNEWAPYYCRNYIRQPKDEVWRFRKALLRSRLPAQTLIEGYWQTEKYFEDIASIIRSDLTLKAGATGQNAEMLHAIEESDSVSVHVRHGDNATSVAKDWGVLPITYYDEAARLLIQQIRRPHFFVFSDDPDWAKVALRLPGPMTFASHNGDEKNYEDLRLMAACKHHITGNSTFSWWGAWLGKKENQIVYAPDKQILYHDCDYRDYYPPSWNILTIRN
jgi:hypothetical protein